MSLENKLLPSHKLPNIKLCFTLYSFRQRLLQERTYFKSRLGHKDFIKKEKKYKKERGITVFLIPIQLSFPIERNAKKEIIFDGRGFACTDSSFKEGHYIMLNDVKNVPRDTLIHEAGHSLGLFHSFQIKDTNEEGKEVIPSHTFEKEKTDNIMDYSNNNRIFWKWQWLKMQKDLEDLEQI